MKKTIALLSPLSKWLMYTGILLFSLLYYLEIVKVLNFHSIMFWVGALFILGSILLFVSGFVHNNALTMLSATLLTLLTGFQALIVIRSGLDYNFAVFVILGSLLVHNITRNLETNNK